MAGPVRVPEDVGKGNAKITLGFRDGKAGKAPATFEIPILEPQSKDTCERKTVP